MKEFSKSLCKPLSIQWDFSEYPFHKHSSRKQNATWFVAGCLHLQWAILLHWGSEILLREPLISLETLISMCGKHWLACVVECMHAKSLQSCPTLCDPVVCSLPGSSVHKILQARILEWVAIPPPGDLPDPGIEPASLTPPALANVW